MAYPSSLPALRAAIAATDLEAARPEDRFPLGLPPMDSWLGGGLARGVLHEVHALRGADAPAAAGFGLGLALRAAGSRPLVWVRQDMVDVEAGGLHGDGVAAFGLDPERLLVVRVRDPVSALRAAAEALRCPAVGAALVETWGDAKSLDLTASRRLALAAAASGVTLVTIRVRAQPAPNAATSRWGLAASASTPLAANAPGRPAFDATLLRHRAGLASRTWRLEWDRDDLCFAAAPLSRPVVPVPAGRPMAADDPALRRRAG